MTRQRWEQDWEEFAAPTSLAKFSSQPNQLRSEVIELLGNAENYGDFGDDNFLSNDVDRKVEAHGLAQKWQVWN